MAREYDFPVYGTQGGGLARFIHGKYIFVEAPPPCMGLDVGSEVPQEWGHVPANNHAEQEGIDRDMADVDPELMEMFTGVLDGRLKWDDIKERIPKRMHDEIREGLGIN